MNKVHKKALENSVLNTYTFVVVEKVDVKWVHSIYP